MRSPSRRNSVFASEQSPQNTPLRWRSTRRNAIASRRRSRYEPGPGGRRIISRRYWREWGRNFVTRIALSRAGASATPAASTVGGASRSRWGRTSYSLRATRGGLGSAGHCGGGEAEPLEMEEDVVLPTGDVERQLLQRVERRARDEEAH